jgi:Tfp pilus assembly protein PilE
LDITLRANYTALINKSNDEMTIAALHAKAARLERELQEIREQLAQETHDAEALARELAQTRAYAFNAATSSLEEVVEKCRDSLDRYGFCVIVNVIPASQWVSLVAGG